MAFVLNVCAKINEQDVHLVHWTIIIVTLYEYLNIF